MAALNHFTLEDILKGPGFEIHDSVIRRWDELGRPDEITVSPTELFAIQREVSAEITVGRIPPIARLDSLYLVVDFGAANQEETRT